MRAPAKLPSFTVATLAGRCATAINNHYHFHNPAPIDELWWVTTLIEPGEIRRVKLLSNAQARQGPAMARAQEAGDSASSAKR